MSRVSRLLPRFLLKASFLRTFGETLLLFMLLTLVTILIFHRINVGTIAVTTLTFFINPCAALYYSLRLRIPDGRWYRRIGLDALWIAVPALLFNPLIWLLTRVNLLDAAIYGTEARGFDALFLSLLAFPYGFFRLTVRFIVWSHYLRQRRIIWSLVSGNLLAVALFQALIGLPLTALLLYSLGNISVEDFADNPLARSFYRFQLSLPVIGLVILVATAVLIALLPVSIAVSYFFARGMRHRLDVLLEAAHAARDGNYDTHIAISGQDEIARLQADFNVMTANLKINVDELRDEREKVTLLLKTRRELMANVSHELRTPIATVRAYLDSALRQQTNTNDVRLSQNDLAIIQRETLHLQTLIDDLFALSRAEVDQLAVKLRPVDGIALIQHVIETMAPLAWNVNRVEIVGHMPASFPQIIADESRLEQVLRNLIHNSLRYTPPGGVVIISIAENEGDAAIQVQDTGEGIQPEHLPHIWERYYRDAENGGTGLGLALVKSFVEAMHGQVAVNSTPGEGACFTIRLPLVKTTPEPDETPLAVDSPMLQP